MWKLKTRTDTHTHTHTHIRTHRQGSSWDNIFSPEMTEYKKSICVSIFFIFFIFVAHVFLIVKCVYNQKKVTIQFSYNCSSNFFLCKKKCWILIQIKNKYIKKKTISRSFARRDDKATKKGLFRIPWPKKSGVCRSANFFYKVWFWCGNRAKIVGKHRKKSCVLGSFTNPCIFTLKQAQQ